MSANESDPVRVMLVGDSPLVRSGFSQVLSSAGIAVVASVATAVEAASLLRHVPADVVVVGAGTRYAGAAETREIRSCDPATAVLVLGRSGDGVAVRAALAAGAQGYLALDDAEDGDLIQAVRSVAAGELYLSPELAVPSAAAVRPPGEGAHQRLTGREREVLTLVARGRSNREIAVMLGLSANTIAVHRANLMKTLAVRKTAALVLYAVRHGLVTAD
jgi:DNA-binding NarL/FixJ family response regulator